MDWGTLDVLEPEDVFTCVSADFNGTCNEACIEIVQEALPVELISFEARKNKEQVSLTWATASEINNSRFEIERSTDGKEFINIGEVKGFGTSNSIIEYAFEDERPLVGTSFYRLKQVDYDGTFEYSNVRSVRFDVAYSISPNPATDLVRIQVEKSNTTLEIYDVGGKLKYKNALLDGNIDTKDLVNGLYLFKVRNQSGEIILAEKIVISR